MTISEQQLQAAAKALVKEYRLIWPGSWPARPEAIRLARAVLQASSVDLSDEPKIHLLAKRLAGAELNYRTAHDRFGGDHIETGREWDKMRDAGDAIREHFFQLEEAAD